MIYWFTQAHKCDSTMKERNSKSMIDFYSKQKIEKLYPDGGFEVIGEIGNIKKKYPGQDIIMTNAYKQIPIFPRGSLKYPFEWIVGYAEVDKELYVAVIRSYLPVFK
ncbi:MAG: hypothetical protein JJE17_05380 [Peptostreptococcaceae bacterium]|nr:hypothetical protein [Peptostreptococcaceae bacterium]